MTDSIGSSSRPVPGRRAHNRLNISLLVDEIGKDLRNGRGYGPLIPHLSYPSNTVAAVQTGSDGWEWNRKSESDSRLPRWTRR